MVQEGKKRLLGPFILCLSGLIKPPPLFVVVQLRRLAPRGHKLNGPRRQKTPSRPIHLMLVGAIIMDECQEKKTIKEAALVKIKSERSFQIPNLNERSDFFVKVKKYF
jgi:hypothetical protein